MKLCNQSIDISIIIPVFCENVKLENTLNSFKQAFTNVDLVYEVILVDNNSTNIDEILAIVKEYRNQHNISLILQPKLDNTFALCSARNRGVENASGRFVFFTDADCMIDAHFANQVLEVTREDEAKHRVYTGERVFIKVPDSPLQDRDFDSGFPNLERVASKSNYGKTKDRRFPWIENLPHQKHPWNFVHGCHIFMKKETYQKVGGSDLIYDGHWGYEEIDLVHRIVSECGGTVHYLDKAKVFHQEQSKDLENLENSSRVSKSNNPNYRTICERIPGYDEFKKQTWQELKIKTT